jgi:cell division protein FtsB
VTEASGGSSAVVLAVGFLIFGALATAVFGWFTSRKSVAFNELEAALESVRIEAVEARELRAENATLKKQVKRLEQEMYRLQAKVGALEAQVGGDGA